MQNFQKLISGSPIIWQLRVGRRRQNFIDPLRTSYNGILKCLTHFGLSKNLVWMNFRNKNLFFQGPSMECTEYSFPRRAQIHLLPPRKLDLGVG